MGGRRELAGQGEQVDSYGVSLSFRPPRSACNQRQWAILCTDGRRNIGTCLHRGSSDDHDPDIKTDSENSEDNYANMR